MENSEVEINSQLNKRILKDRFERIEVQEQNDSTTGRVLEGTQASMLFYVSLWIFLEEEYVSSRTKWYVRTM